MRTDSFFQDTPSGLFIFTQFLKSPPNHYGCRDLEILRVTRQCFSERFHYPIRYAFRLEIDPLGRIRAEDIPTWVMNAKHVSVTTGIGAAPLT